MAHGVPCIIRSKANNFSDGMLFLGSFLFFEFSGKKIHFTWALSEVACGQLDISSHFKDFWTFVIKDVFIVRMFFVSVWKQGSMSTLFEREIKVFFQGNQRFVEQPLGSEAWCSGLCSLRTSELGVLQVQSFNSCNCDHSKKIRLFTFTSSPVVPSTLYMSSSSCRPVPTMQTLFFQFCYTSCSNSFDILSGTRNYKQGWKHLVLFFETQANKVLGFGVPRGL